MRLSLCFMGIAPIASTLPAVVAAERLGFDGVCSAEHIGFHDAIVPSAVYLRETRRLEVSVVGISTAGRHPGLIAMELSSLAGIDEVSLSIAAAPEEQTGIVKQLARARPVVETDGRRSGK
jgi:hypothetical protein